MSIADAAKFFEENWKQHAGARSDPTAHNLNKGLQKLAVELDKELRQIHREIAHLSAQIGQIPIR